MQFVFLDMAGKTLFIRDDAERAQWTQEEMSLDLEFPYLSDKHISIGQRIFFKDPSTGEHQIYEVKQAKTNEPDHYQQIAAEHICISELTDEHLDNKDILKKTAGTALDTVLTGTLWKRSTTEVNTTSSVKLSRGSVWQAVLNIATNWNVYIVPKVTLAADGTITRRLLIKSTDGEWNGVRLSINKNLLDPAVTYDDSEVVTALYGYGGTQVSSSAKDKDKEIDFSDVVWKKTADHPAKPKGQKYLEDPAATAAYGRDGRARFGFYQNNDITDPETLLQKTWETLQLDSKPSICIDGTVADLYRLGYADQPIKLHDIALVEVNPAGFKQQLQITRITTDLLDPSATTLTIGKYIPNIIYITNETNIDATGGRGGGGNKAQDTNEKKEFEAQIGFINEGTGVKLTAFQRDMTQLENDVKLQESSIEVLHDQITQEVIAREKEDNIITKEFSGKIETQAKQISLVVTEKNGKDVVNTAEIVTSINNSGSNIKLKADTIDIDGLITKLDSKAIGVGSLRVEGLSNFLRPAYFEAGIICDSNIDCSGVVVTGSESAATWQSTSVTSGTASAAHYFLYASSQQSSTPSGSAYGCILGGASTKTIYYLGHS